MEDGSESAHLQASSSGDGLDSLQVAEDECRHAIQDVINSSEALTNGDNKFSKGTQQISAVVEYSNKLIYKSTLVSELNKNPFLSKD